MAASGSIIKQLIELESIRAFPNQFEVTVSNADAKGAKSADALAQMETSALAQNFSFYATKIALGAYAVDTERILSTQQTIIKKATVPDIVTLSVKETEDWATLKYFWQWYTTYYYNPLNNLFRIGREGKRKTFVIYALSSPYYGSADIGNHYRFKITVKDALLVGPIQMPTFDYRMSDPVEHNFTIQSDYITLEFDGDQIPAAAAV